MILIKSYKVTIQSKVFRIWKNYHKDCKYEVLYLSLSAHGYNKLEFLSKSKVFFFNNYCQFFEPNFLLCSRNLNRPARPIKSSFNVILKSIIFTANGTIDALFYFRQKTPLSQILKSFIGYHLLLIIASFWVTVF